MPRGQRKSIDDKIAAKVEVVEALEVRLKKEREELESLQNDKIMQEVESLHTFMKVNDLSTEEAIEILKEKMSK